jgi:hypothetical protein
MKNRWNVSGAAALVLAVEAVVFVHSDESEPKRPPKPPPFDAIADAQTPRPVHTDRPELHKSAHDQSDVFAADKAPDSSEALPDQPDKGEFPGFDFARAPLGAKKPMATLEEIMKQDEAVKSRRWPCSRSCSKVAAISSLTSIRMRRCRAANPTSASSDFLPLPLRPAPDDAGRFLFRAASERRQGSCR